MVVCPVCEHQQSFGVECDVCGKDLGDLGELGLPPPSAETPMEGLEVTIGERVGTVETQAVVDLEVTRFDAAQAVPLEVVPDLEARQLVGEVAVERVTDLSLDRAPDDGVRTAAPTGTVACRYCRAVQPSGLICNSCGMRLPKTVAPPAEPGTTKPKQQFVRGDARCKACGAPAIPGERCSECGALAALPE